MRMRVYQEDLEQLFDRADCPSIFSRKTKTQISLDSIQPGQSNTQLSIKAMKSIIQALVFLRLNLILPCQLKFEYIRCKDNQWGLCYAICERNLEQNNITSDSYNPEEYQYHLDSQNQLVWNLGKVWLRFFTEEPIRIKMMNQNEINSIINESVKDKNINSLLKKLLIIDRNKRVKFEQILSYEVLVQQQKQQSKYYSSLMVHLNNLSYLMGSQAGMSNFQKINPFIVQINYRRFRQYLDIDLFIQSVKSDIKKSYGDGEDNQKASCDFSIHIISLQNYINMVSLNKERLQLGQRFQQITDRIYYAKFTKRMLTIKEILQKKIKVLKNNKSLKPSLIKYLQEPDSIDKKSLYNQFKACLNEYAQLLKQDLQKDKNDLTALKLLTKIYIIRCSGYIFNQYRTEVFKAFFNNQQQFNIKKLLNRLNQTNSLQNLRITRNRIIQFYFKN